MSNVNETTREPRFSTKSFIISHVQVQYKFPLSLHLILFVTEFADNESYENILKTCRLYHCVGAIVRAQHHLLSASAEIARGIFQSEETARWKHEIRAWYE